MDIPARHPNPETRQALIEAALRCFAKYGYEATSIRLVASMAGKNASLISYHFGNKEGLYRQVIEHLLASLPKLAITQDGPDQAPCVSPQDRLAAFIRRFIAVLDDSFSPTTPDREIAYKLWFAEWHRSKPEVRDLIQAYAAEAVAELREVIHDLRPDLEPSDVAFCGVVIHDCCLAHVLNSEINRLAWPELPTTGGSAQMVDRLTHFIHQGLAGFHPAGLASLSKEQK